MDLEILARNCRNIDPWQILMPILENYVGLFEKANRDQLWDGKTSLNQDIHPNYFEDSYFPHTTANGRVITALQYAKWKDGGKWHNPKRKMETPNMYIDGTLVYNTIKASLLDSGINITATAASSFEGKFANIYGVTEDNLKVILLGKPIEKFRTALLKAMAKE